MVEPQPWRRVFHTYAKSKLTDYKDADDSSWSGKIEFNTSFILNKQKNLILDMRFSHYFPYHERMIRYKAMSLLGCYLRYNLLNDRLTLTASVTDPLDGTQQNQQLFITIIRFTHETTFTPALYHFAYHITLVETK